VIFSNAGTIAKFDRMGVAAGYGPEGYKYFRVGLRHNPDPNAINGKPFTVDVSDPDYEEFWTQEIQVFHNPDARHPLRFEALPGFTHHFFKDGQLQSFVPEDVVLSSLTMIVGHYT